MKNSIGTIAVENSGFLQSIDLNADAGSELKVGPALLIDSPLEGKLNLLFKRSFDIIFSSIAILAFLSWLIPVIALLIKLDSRGSVFFWQKRVKKNRRFFTCLKFRTMVANDEADTMAAYVNDHRITRIGSFLRRHHLDELPQLFNVWWGDMSLIGPRPYMISDDQKFERMMGQYSVRYKVKPGITGLAQSKGHFGILLSENEMRQRLKLDLYYIRSWSLGLDVKIIYLTFLRAIGF